MSSREMIRLEKVSFRYEGTDQGVADVDLSVKEGECVVLTGASGCGKTTLTRLINALAPGYFAGTLQGKIMIDGTDISGIPSWETGRVVGSVFQDPKSQFFASELFGEVAFACENYGLPQSEIRELTNRAVEELGLMPLRDRALDVISSGEMQRVAIASVHALSPSIFVFDEPTANLDEEGVRMLREVVLKLKSDGHTLLIAEHRLFWLKDVADRFVHMEEGRIEAAYTTNDFLLLPEEERLRMGLRRIDETEAPGPEKSVRGEPILEARGLSKKKGKQSIFSNMNLTLCGGEIVALTGRNGKGKTTLAMVLSGLEKETGGEILLHGMPVTGKVLRRHIYYCSNQTGNQFFTPSVSEELLLGVPRDEATLDRARRLLKRLDLYAYKEEHPASLSGGQKLRLAVAIALFSGREVLILDEPTSGLDGRNMRLMAGLLKEAVEKGQTILIVTHDRELVDACCDREVAL